MIAKSERKAWILPPIFVLSGVVGSLFVLDLVLPLGVASGVPYLFAVFLTKDMPGRRVTVLVGVLCSGLTVAGYFLSPPGGKEWQVLVNRGLSILAIGMTSLFMISWKEYAEEVRKRAEDIQAVIDLIPHMIYVRDENGKMTMANRQTAESLGISREELLGLHEIRLSMDPVEEEKRRQAETRVREQQKPECDEHEVYTSRQGETRIFQTTRMPFRSLYIPGECVLTVSIDQTDQMLLKGSWRLAKQMFDGSSDQIAILDLNYRYRRVNPAYEMAHGTTMEGIVGSSVSDLLGNETFQYVIKPRLDQCLVGKEVMYESWFTFRRAGERYMIVTYTPLRTSHGVVEGIVVVARDITDRKQAELGRARLEYAVDRAIEGLSLHDENGIFVYVNSAEAKMYGYERDELVGHSWEKQYDEAEVTRIKHQVFPILKQQGSWRGELLGRRKTGEKFRVLVSLTLLNLHDRYPAGLVCTCQEITDKRRETTS